MIKTAVPWSTFITPTALQVSVSGVLPQESPWPGRLVIFRPIRGQPQFMNASAIRNSTSRANTINAASNMAALQGGGGNESVGGVSSLVSHRLANPVDDPSRQNSTVLAAGITSVTI
jgi:hypothetical protein